jgi:4-hydroxy-3-polyprenylbenzoate decarboxylase
MKKTIITGITGASGSIYALNFIKHAAALKIDLRVVVTEMGASVFKHETGMTVSEAAAKYKIPAGGPEGIRIYNNNDMFADIASGSYKTDGMVVIPCSMKTLSGIANGYSSSLLERAADVMLKEKRRLILAVRETPLSLIHLKNMTSAAEAGAVILPAAPGFYHKPETIDDLADFMTGKILDQLGIEHKLKTVWNQK